MPTTSTTVSRLELDHPDLGHDGGAGLHTKVRDAWTKIGDNIDSRFFTEDALANGASVDFDHNFKTAFDELRINLFTRNIGDGELTRIEIGGSPDLNDFTIVATPGSLTTQVRITNNTGGPIDLAAVVVHGKGAEIIDDLEDVDTTTTPPENGQALVWDGTNFVPGASGDASFKIQSVTTAGVTVIKGGFLIDDKGREFGTYDGAGSASTDFGSDLTIDLDNLESAPVNNTTYYLYLDEAALQAAITATDNGRKIYPVEEGQLVLLTDFPDTANLTRYTPLGFVRYATAQWSDTIFGSTAFRRHDDPSVVVSPVQYTLSKQVVGAVGSSGQIRAGHLLDDDSFRSFTTEISYFNLAADALDDSGNARDLTNVGTTPFTGANIFGTASAAANLNGTTQYFESSNAFFNPGDADFSAGGWFNIDWATGGGNEILFGHYTANGLLIQTDSTNSDINFTAGGATKDLDIPYTFGDSEWHHIAVTYEASADLWRVYFDGEEVATLVKANVAWGGTLKLGAFAAGADFMTGQMEDFFFSTLLFNPLEIKKTASTRLDHNQNVPVANQLWSFNHFDTATSDLASPLSDVVLDLKTNKAYVDLYATLTTDSVEGKLQDCGTSAITVPVRTFDRTFTSNPTFPIDTFLASDATSVELLKLTSGKWTVVADGNSLVDVGNSGNRPITGDISSTTPTVASPVRLVIATTPAALAVSKAKENIAGIMELQWGGFTKFVGGTHPDNYPTLTDALAAAVAGDCILVASDYTISAAETISVADILIVFKPGVKITVDTAIATGALLVSAARVDIVGARYEADFAGTLGSFIQLTASADDCNIVRALLEANDAGLTVTQALDALSGASRNEFRASMLATLGTITAAFADAGTDNDITIRG